MARVAFDWCFFCLRCSLKGFVQINFSARVTKLFTVVLYRFSPVRVSIRVSKDPGNEPTPTIMHQASSSAFHFMQQLMLQQHHNKQQHTTPNAL